MNLIRSIMSVFLLALLVLSVAGWIWAGGQPSPKMEGARLVLALCGLSAIGCMWLLWTAKPGAIGEETAQAMPKDKTAAKTKEASADSRKKLNRVGVA
jgi:hypothetical protein